MVKGVSERFSLCSLWCCGCKTGVEHRVTLSKYLSMPESSVETNDKFTAGKLASVYDMVKNSLSYNDMDCAYKLLPYMCRDSKIVLPTKESFKNILNTIQGKNFTF